VSDQLHAHWIGGWLDPRDSLDVVVKTKFPAPAGSGIPDHLAHSPALIPLSFLWIILMQYGQWLLLWGSFIGSKYAVSIALATDWSPSWEADSRLVDQEILRLLWDPEVHLPLNPTLIRFNQVQTPTPYFFKTTLTLSCHRRLVLPKAVFPSGLPSFLYWFLITPMRAICFTHIIFD
jgi:hypothetical protein